VCGNVFAAFSAAMLLTISYCQGHGWHVGRLLVWGGLLAVGIPLAFVGVFVEAIFKAGTHLSIPLALCVPLVFGLLLYRRLKRKYNGQPFAVCLPEFFMDDTTTLLIPKGHKHFRALVMLEIFIWGSVIVSQFGILGVFYGSDISHRRSSQVQTDSSR
jgi:hypothetical protein